MRPFHPLQVDDFRKKDIVNHMYIVTMKIRFSKLDQENLAMKIQVSENQYPSNKIFFRGYGEYAESRIIKNNQGYDEVDRENQKDFSDDIKKRSNFKVNHASYFCEKTY